MADEPTRQAMHAILDLVVGFDEDASEEANRNAFQTTLKRLGEIDAVAATFDDDTDVLSLEVTPLLTAVGVTVDTLLRQLASERGHDRLTILNVVREHLDEVLSED